MKGFAVPICLMALFAMGLQFSNPVLCHDYCRANDSWLETPVSTFEGGNLYQNGSLRVLELSGSYRQMGRQYGALLEDDLLEIYNEMSLNYGDNDNESFDYLFSFMNRSFQLYPQRYKEMIYGMAETSGLGVEKMLAVEALPIYLLHDEGCSAMAVWGNYTAGGPLVIARNYDWSDGMRDRVVLVVLNPDDGSIPLANIHYAGSVYVNTGLNREGIFLETNGDLLESVYCSNIVPTSITFLSLLGDYCSLDQVEGGMRSVRPSDGCIVNIVDEDEARSYEWTIYDLKLREPDSEGLLVSTNHFLNPSWGFEPPSSEGNNTLFTVERRRNLLTLAEKNKGRFSPQVMMDVMSLSLDQGGAMMTSGLPTSYQVVAVPEELKVWIRMPELQDWTEVDLMGLFD